MSNYGSFSCKCKNGYSGNGKLCEGSLLLLVVIIAAACQATRASSVTVMAVFYTVYFCYLAKLLQILMSVLWISTTVMKMLCASILLAVTHACVIMDTLEMESTVNHVILIILF